MPRKHADSDGIAAAELRTCGPWSSTAMEAGAVLEKAQGLPAVITPRSAAVVWKVKPRNPASVSNASYSLTA